MREDFVLDVDPNNVDESLNRKPLLSSTKEDRPIDDALNKETNHSCHLGDPSTSSPADRKVAEARPVTSECIDLFIMLFTYM